MEFFVNGIILFNLWFKTYLFYSYSQETPRISGFFSISFRLYISLLLFLLPETVCLSDGSISFYVINISTTRVGLNHLKVEDREYDISLIKKICLTISLQKISSIHKRPHPPKNHWSNFSFPEFARACKQTSLLHQLILDIQSILESKPIFGHSQAKNFRSTFNFHKFVQHGKNQVILSICSKDKVDLKIL